MTRHVKLREVATARAGDKGNTSNISVWVKDAADYPWLKQALTPELIGTRLGKLFRGRIRRYDLDGLQGFNFVLEEALEGGVNTSLNLDFHGKSFSFLLLGLELEVPDTA